MAAGWAFAVQVIARMHDEADTSISVARLDCVYIRLYVLVHAKDDNAKGFYEHFSFEPSPSDPYHPMLIMKDLRRASRRPMSLHQSFNRLMPAAELDLAKIKE